MNNKANNKAKWMLRLFLCIIIFTIAGLIMLIISHPAPPQEIPPEQAIPVSVRSIQKQTIENTTRLPASIQAWLDVKVPIEKAGTVTELPVDKGEIVTNGQILLKIDDRVWVDALKQAELELRESGKDFTRWQEMHKSGAVSKSDFDDYKTRSESAQISVDNARINLEKCSVVSPINGYVNNRMTEIGEYVNEGAPVFQVLQLDKMKLTFDIPERNIMSVHVGDSLPFTINGLPEKEFKAVITFISAQAAANNAYKAEATVKNHDLLLKAGMIAQTELSVGNIEQAIVIPLASIVPDKGDHVAFTIDDNQRAHRNVVTIDAIQGTRAIIATGLEAGAQLVTEGHRSLNDGALVEIIEPAGN